MILSALFMASYVQSLTRRWSLNQDMETAFIEQLTPIIRDGSIGLHHRLFTIICCEGLKILIAREINFDLSDCWALNCTLAGRWHTWKSVRSLASTPWKSFGFFSLILSFNLSTVLFRDTETLKIEEVPSTRHPRSTSAAAI